MNPRALATATAAWPATGCAPGWAGDAGGYATALGLLLPLAVLLGMFFHARRRPPALATLTAPSAGPADPGAASARPPMLPAATAGPDLCLPALRRFQAWLGEAECERDLWPAFDLFLRQLLGDLLGAERVRTFRVFPANEQLLPLSPAEAPAGDTPLFARLGLLGHVVTSGRTYAADDLTQGELVCELAGQDPQRWTCVWPTRSGHRALGVVAVRCPAGVRVGPAERELLGALFDLFWTLVDARDRGDAAFESDRESGVLNRQELFVRGQQVVAAAAEDHEPVVVAVLALEGMRKLTDGALWTQRHELVDGIGTLLLARVRSDDCVGRLTDDCFTVLLRRVDSALAQLIARKLQQAVERELERHLAPELRLTVRMGVAGSGLGTTHFETLLERANALLADARAQQRPLALDLPSAPERTP